MRVDREFVRLDGARLTLVFALCEGGWADLIYLGERLGADEALDELAAATARGRHESQPDSAPVPGLLPERKSGWGGEPAFAWLKDGALVSSDLHLVKWQAGDAEIALHYEEALSGVSVELRWDIGQGDMITATASIHNSGDAPITITRAASLAFPIPPRFTHISSFSGRWASEMREHLRPITPDGFARQSAIGKPGFEGAGWVLLHDPSSGEAIATHCGWSGDQSLRIECDNAGAGDGRALLQMGAGFDAGEIVLGPGASFTSPPAFLARGADRSSLAQSLHTHLRRQILPARADWGPRKVHLNTWEALGFNLSNDALIELAEVGAVIGVERFVLDDGWFGGRRSDQTSLGDWTVSRDVFPDGLAPLIDHIYELGMDFGLWVEPEMVSPESELFRAHPDWCVHEEGCDQPTMRGQLTLDLTRSEVRDYLFEALDQLLSEHAIAYLKWDHNRDLFPSHGRRYAQTEGFLELLDRVRAAHPAVEIESCSSGGGRIDYGVLSRCHRVWPSDNNDTLERARIMRAWSQFVPLEALGNHVGPSPNPITGRKASMHFRSRMAMLGHMGIEADPRAMSEGERALLSSHIALYKSLRGVLHEGDLWRLDHPDPQVHAMMVTHHGKALALAAQTGFSPAFDTAPLRLAGLDASARYRVTLPEPWPRKAALYLADPARWREGLNLSGAALMTQGLALPLTHPETAWLIALERLTE